MWRWLWQRVQDEPAMTWQLVNGAVLLAVGFGLQWTGEQVALVGTFTALLIGWLTRKTVTPVARAAAAVEHQRALDALDAYEGRHERDAG